MHVIQSQNAFKRLPFQFTYHSKAKTDLNVLLIQHARHQGAKTHMKRPANAIPARYSDEKTKNRTNTIYS